MWVNCVVINKNIELVLTGHGQPQTPSVLRRCGCVKKGLKCGAGCHCKNCGNIQSECVDGSPIRRQLPSQECQVVEEEESMYDTQLREQGGDKLVHLDEEELPSEVVVVMGECFDDSEDEDASIDDDFETESNYKSLSPS